MCVDVCRVQGEQIIEHRDALAPTPAADAEVMFAGGGDGLADVGPSRVSANAARARLSAGSEGLHHDRTKALRRNAW